MKKTDILIIAVLLVSAATLAVNLIPEEQVVLTHCGAGQYLDTDTKTCILKSTIQPETIIQEKIVETTITETIPMNVIRGISNEQNIFIVDNGVNPTVFIQHCNGLTVMNNPILTTEDNGSFTLRDSVAGMTIFVDKTSSLQYQITTVPYSGESVNTIGTELMRSDVYDVQCEEEEQQSSSSTTSDVFYYDIELTNNNSILRIEGDVGKIVDNDRSITGMILLYDNGQLQNHIESFDISLDSNGEFFETINVEGTSNSGKEWEDNETYRVLINYNGQQMTRDFEK
jgi:hypothetical protein